MTPPRRKGSGMTAAELMRQLAADSLELLSAALPASLLRRFPALLTLPVWGSIIGARWLLAVPVPASLLPSGPAFAYLLHVLCGDVATCASCLCCAPTPSPKS